MKKSDILKLSNEEIVEGILKVPEIGSDKGYSQRDALSAEMIRRQIVAIDRFNKASGIYSWILIILSLLMLIFGSINIFIK